MTATIRPAVAADATECGRIIHDAFAAVSGQHSFPKDFPSVEAGRRVAEMLIAAPGFYGVVAEADGRIIGSNFLDERGPIAGVGPITVDPAQQDGGVGRRLMEAVMARAAARSLPGIRLVQDAFHNRSLCLYTSLGFVAREPLSVMQGGALGLSVPGYNVRAATPADRDACNALCRRVHGFERSADLDYAISEGTAAVVEHLGRITGYATQLAFFGHTVGNTNDDLKALIGAAREFAGPGFILPTRNHDLFGWCLEQRLRLVKQMTLMSIGLYNEPAGAWLPSVLF